MFIYSVNPETFAMLKTGEKRCFIVIILIKILSINEVKIIDELLKNKIQRSIFSENINYMIDTLQPSFIMNVHCKK
jgi:hypothetical protein